MDYKAIFETDKTRQALARQGKLKELEQTYDGTYPDLPSMNSSEMWDFFMSHGELHRDPVSYHRLKMTARYIDPSARILDFGVGYGWIIPLLLEKNPGLDYTGVDFSAVSIEKLRTQYPALTFMQGDTKALPAGSFDYCLALEVFEHIEPKNVLGVYKELNRLLKPGGHVVISVPAWEDLVTMCHICSACGSLQSNVGHIRSYTPELLSAELALSGFQVVDTRVTDNYFGAARKMIKLAKYMLGEEIQKANIIVRAVKQ